MSLQRLIARPMVTQRLDPIVLFYRGVGTDQSGRTIEEVRRFSFDELEDNHDFIQWLFPLPERSMANDEAPILSKSVIAVFLEDPELQVEMVKSLDVILRFWGLQRNGTMHTPVVSETVDANARMRLWVCPGNHNFLRISRVLRSMALLGLKAHSEALLEYLEGLYSRNPNIIGLRTISFWRERAQS